MRRFLPDGSWIDFDLLCLPMNKNKVSFAIACINATVSLACAIAYGGGWVAAASSAIMAAFFMWRIAFELRA
jgi:hypothetical protein